MNKKWLASRAAKIVAVFISWLTEPHQKRIDEKPGNLFVARDFCALTQRTWCDSVNGSWHPLAWRVEGKMLENSDDLMSIVVLEAGAIWPGWLGDYQRLAPNAVVIAEARAESIASFEARVVHRVEEATARSGPRVRVGVMVLADAGNQERGMLRRNVAKALLKAMGSSHEAELVLAGDGQEIDGSRHELFALAGTLCEELGGTHVNVRVRFSNGKSGVMRTVSASSPELDALTSKSQS